MQEEVVLEVGLLAEAPVTDVTAEGPGAAVDVHVTPQVTRRGERLGAQRALMGLLLHGKKRRHAHVYIIVSWSVAAELSEK